MIIKTIRQIVENRDLPRVAPDLTVREACHALDRLNVGAVAVMEGDRLVGVFSERDVLRKCICRTRRTDETRVADIMTADPATIPADRGLVEALDIMVAGGFRHLPVLDGGRVIGMLSMRDIPTEYRLMRERLAEARAPLAPPPGGAGPEPARA